MDVKKGNSQKPLQEASPLQKIKNAYAKVLKFEVDDEMAVDVYVAALAATFCTRLDEQVWIYIIAPPGSGKTELVSTARDFRKCLLLTTPTENAFMSGYNDETGEDPSLLPMLNGKVLIWKDFTALIDGNPRMVDKILGEMRDSFDQFSSKASGKGGLREYSTRYGQIACVTDRIDTFAESHQQLGQRFLSFRMNRVKRGHRERVANLYLIVKSMDGKQKWKKELRELVHGELELLVDKCMKGEIPTIPAGAKRKVLIMADLLALTRTVPVHKTAVSPELATRLVQQLLNLGLAHAISDSRDEWDESDTLLVKRVFMDSLSQVRCRLLQFLYRQGPHRPAMPMKQMWTKCRTDKTEMERIISQYTHSGILETSADESSEEVWYRLTDDIYKALQEVGVFDKEAK